MTNIIPMMGSEPLTFVDRNVFGPTALAPRDVVQSIGTIMTLPFTRLWIFFAAHVAIVGPR